MAEPSLIERLLQIRGTQFTPIENALVTEAASTLEDQARLIGECREVMTKASEVMRESVDCEWWRGVIETADELDALLTKLNAFGEQA